MAVLISVAGRMRAGVSHLRTMVDDWKGFNMWRGRKWKKTPKIHTLIGANTEVRGDILFDGGLHVDGTIKGNVIANGNSASILTLSEQGSVEGEVKVPNIILNGRVVGDIYATERVELASRARVAGNVHYNLIEMAMGAEVNGRLLHHSEVVTSPKVLPASPEVASPPEVVPAGSVVTPAEVRRKGKREGAPALVE